MDAAANMKCINATNQVQASEDQRDDAVWPLDLAASTYVPATRFRGVRKERNVVVRPDNIDEKVFTEWNLDSQCCTVLNDAVPQYAPPLLGDISARASPYDKPYRAIGRVKGISPAALDPVAHYLLGKTPEYRRARMETLFWKMPHYAANVLLRMRDIEQENARIVALGNKTERLQVQFQMCPRADSWGPDWSKTDWHVFAEPRPVPHTLSMGLIAVDQHGVARPPAAVDQHVVVNVPKVTFKRNGVIENEDLQQESIYVTFGRVSVWAVDDKWLSIQTRFSRHGRLRTVLL